MPNEKLNAGRYIVSATSFLSLFSIVGIMFYGIPFYFDFWVKEFNWSRATVTSGNIAGKVIIGPLFGFLAGWVIDKFGPRRLMLFGILMAGLSVICLSTMNSLWQFYTFYLMMALGYMCGGPLPNQVLTSRWFEKSRGKAMGFAYLGIGVGGMLVPQIARGLNLRMDWRSSLFYLGVFMIVVAFPVAWFVKENPLSNKQQPTKVKEPEISFKNIVRDKSFYLLAIGSMCSIGTVAGISQNLKLFFALDLNYSQAYAANIISLVLGASIIGRLVMGWLADKFPKKYVMILIYMLITLSIFLLYFADTPGVIYVFAFIFGIGLGGDYMIIPLMAADLFGVKVMGRVMGLILTVDGIGEATGPILAGSIRDNTGSYVHGFTALIILSIVGTLAIAMLPLKRRSYFH